MKTLITLLAILAGIFCLESAQAVYRTLYVEWGYTSSVVSPQLSGFRLYKNGEVACTFDGPDDRVGDCTTDITSSSESFTMTALFVDETESPHSSPYIFTLGGLTAGRFIIARRGPKGLTISKTGGTVTLAR